MGASLRIGGVALHWLARATGLALAGLVLLLLVGEGGPDPFKSTPLENLQHLAFIVIVPLALIAAWRWPLFGGLVAVVALGAFYAINIAGSGSAPGGAFPLFFIPAVLYIIDGLLPKRSSTIRGGGTRIVGGGDDHTAR